MRFSVVVPAHNEELLLPATLHAIAVAATHVAGHVEVIVVANRCTDATAAIARDAGAVVIEDALMEVATFVTRLGGGCFWCFRSDFEAVNGFDEAKLLAEDLDFARRLRTHGKRTGRGFTTMRSATGTCSGWRCSSARSAPS